MSNGEARRRRWQHHSCAEGAEGAEGGNVLCRCSLKMAAATLVVVADLAAVEQSANYYYYW